MEDILVAAKYILPDKRGYFFLLQDAKDRVVALTRGGWGGNWPSLFDSELEALRALTANYDEAARLFYCDPTGEVSVSTMSPISQFTNNQLFVVGWEQKPGEMVYFRAEGLTNQNMQKATVLSISQLSSYLTEGRIAIPVGVRYFTTYTEIELP